MNDSGHGALGGQAAEGADNINAVGTSTPRRKKIDMPRSLPELHQAAMLHLYQKKKPNRLRLFHRGNEIRHPGVISQFADGDEVHTYGANLAKEEDQPTTSTHHASYVHFGDVEPGKPTMDDTMSVLTAVSAGKPLAGTSMSHSDFVWHPYSKRSPSEIGTQTSNLKPTSVAPMGKSSYNQHFIRHERPEPERHHATRESVISQHSLGRKFDAQSAYKSDYHREKGWKPPPRERIEIDDNTSTLTDAVKRVNFNGQSTYQGHYVNFPGAEKRQSCRHDDDTERIMGIQGNSEYRRQYLGVTQSKGMPAIHLVKGD